MSLADRDRLVFDYTRMMMAALYLNPSPQRVLIIGLGGGTLPGALQKILPAARIDAVEVDPAVVRVAGKYFGFAPGRQTTVFEEDGRVFVKRMQKQQIRYDLVLLDAFDHEYIPEHLLTREFLLEVRSILAPGGVLAANTFATSRLYHFESATYFSAFGDFYRLKQQQPGDPRARRRVARLGRAGAQCGPPGRQARAARGGQGMAVAAHRGGVRLAAGHARAHRPIFAVEPAERIQLSSTPPRP